MSSDRRHQGPRAVAAAGRHQLREDRLDERERKADQREALADERQHEADRREALADEREALANERDSEASQREKRLDEWEHSLAEQAGVYGFQQYLLRRINQTRASLDADPLRHPGPLQAVAGDLATTCAQHRQAWADHDRDHLRALLREAIQQGEATREHTRAVIAILAATKEAAAQGYDVLAGAWPDHADKYRQLAERARASAQRSYRILNDSPGLAPATGMPHTCHSAWYNGSTHGHPRPAALAAELPLPTSWPMRKCPSKQ